MSLDLSLSLSPLGRQLNVLPGRLNLAALFKTIGGVVTDTVGLSVSEIKATIDPALYDILFVVVDGVLTKRPAVDVVTLSIASPLFNKGTLIGKDGISVAIYAYGTPSTTLEKAFRYFHETYVDTVSISIPGTGLDETNYILPVFLHMGLPTGEVTGNNFFLSGRGSSDFSDIRFIDGETELQHYLHSHGNYEIIPDHNRVARVSAVAPDGTIYAINTSGTAVQKSIDNGANWSSLYTATMVPFIFRNSSGSLFVVNVTTHRLLKSSDNGQTWGAVGPDMTAVSGIIVYNAMIEDSTGNLYFGRYQDSNDVKIYKSTDGGDTWADITPTALITGFQHVHGMYVDTYQSPEVVYAGIDGLGRAIIKTSDGGANWTMLANTPAAADPNGFGSGDGFRLFSGEAGIKGRWSVYRTTDDETFVPVLDVSQNITGIRKIGNVFYAFGATYGVNKYSQVYRSDDDGLTWKTVWIAPYNEDANVSAGMRYPSYPGTSANSDNQIMVGVLEENLDEDYKNSRVFEGGNHHSALYYLKIPTLPAAGKSIAVSTGVVGTSTKSLFNWAGNVGVAPILHYKLNEGSGTAINDSSANVHHGILTPGTGSWDVEKRRAGWAQPDITEDGGGSFNFNGDGKILVTGSATDPDFAFLKNCTFITWMNSPNSSAGSTLRWLMGRGSYGTKTFSILFRDSGSLQFSYFSGGTMRSKVGNVAPISFTDGGTHMLSLVIDNASPPNITWGLDVVDSAPVALDYEPDLAQGQDLFSIGMGAAGGQPCLNNISEVMVFNTALTVEQKRLIFEARF